MYIMGTLLRHGSEEQKRRYLPKIAAGELRLQAFGVTEPNAGSETTRIETAAVRKGDRYVVNGQKVFISRVPHSDLMLLLARTTPYDQLKNKTEGLSLFLVDLHAANGAIEVRPLDLMVNHESTALYITDLEIPAENLIGEEGWFVERAARYAGERRVFGRPIGANQGVQFPIARAYAAVEAADLMRYRAAALFDRGEKCGPQANMAKLLASEASRQAANACMDAHGGYGLAAEYDVERKFRETRLYTVAPINNNLVLAYLGQHVLGMPRSY